MRRVDLGSIRRSKRDVREVRRHLEKLSAAGIGHRTVARRVGVWPEYVQDLRRGRYQTIRDELAERILAVTSDDASPETAVDPTLLLPLLDALCDCGMSDAAVARALDTTAEWPARVRRGQPVRRYMVHRLRELYSHQAKAGVVPASLLDRL